MSIPFFSVVIPALNEEKYLPNLLKDLGKQSLRDFEVIVVDGESSDQTVKYAKLVAHSLPLLTITTSTKRHVCTQRNLGAKGARADWLIFMDADNRLPPYFLQGVKYRLEQSPTDVATCWIKSDGMTAKDKSIALAINYAQEIMEKSKSPAMMESVVICGKRAFQKIGGFDESVDIAEGTVFTKTALQKHLKYTIYRDPTYTYSFRRIRKYGALNIAGNLAQHEIAKLLDIPLSKAQIAKLYPMKGGTLFRSSTKKRNEFSNKITYFLRELRSPDTIKQKLQELLED